MYFIQNLEQRKNKSKWEPFTASPNLKIHLKQLNKIRKLIQFGILLIK